MIYSTPGPAKAAAITLLCAVLVPWIAWSLMTATMSFVEAAERAKVVVIPIWTDEEREIINRKPDPRTVLPDPSPEPFPGVPFASLWDGVTVCLRGIQYQGWLWCFPEPSDDDPNPTALTIEQYITYRTGVLDRHIEVYMVGDFDGFLYIYYDFVEGYGS